MSIPPGLELFPIQQPPDGIIATFEREHSHSRWIISVVAVSFGIATIIAGIRAFTKLRIIKRVAYEDYALLITWALYAAFCGVTFKAISRGAFHQWNVYLKDAHFFLYWYRLVGTIYEFTIGAIKVIIALELIRLFVPWKQGPLYRVYIVLIVISIVSGALGGFMEAFHCLPMNKQWEPLLLINPNYGRCFDIDTARIVLSATLVAQDFALLLLPQYSIWNLKMSKRRKLGVSVLFGFGIAGCIASTVRLYYTVQVKTQKDVLWNLIFLGVCIVLEATCGIIVAAAPTLPKFATYLRELGFGISEELFTGFIKPQSSEKHNSSVEPRGIIHRKDRDDTPNTFESDETAFSVEMQANNGLYHVKTSEHYVRELVSTEMEDCADQEMVQQAPTPPTHALLHQYNSRIRDWDLEALVYDP